MANEKKKYVWLGVAGAALATLLVYVSHLLAAGAAELGSGSDRQARRLSPGKTDG